MTRTHTLRRLAAQARPYYPRLTVAILLGALTGVLMIAPAWALKLIFDDVIQPASKHTGTPRLGVLYTSLAVTYVALVAANFATYGTNYITTWCGQRFLANLRQQLYERLLRAPIQVFDRWRPGELISRFSSDLQIMSDAISVSVPQLITAIMTFIASFAYIFYLDWLLTVVLVVLAPMIALAVTRFQKLISGSMHHSQSRIADMYSSLSEIFSAQRIVKAFGREQHESTRFKERNEDYFTAFMKLNQFVYMQPAVVSAIIVAAVVAIIWFSAREVLAGRLTSGSLMAYWTAVVNLINPMNRMAAFVGDISKATVATGRAYELMDLAVEEDPQPSTPLAHVRGEIEFRHVRFWYDPDEAPALDDVNVHIQAGEIVALVGPSGAGKTTFVNMIPRFYHPQQGRILVDGIDIADVKVADLRSQIAIVPQDSQLFRASVADNIRYGRLDATDTEVREAAIEANADEFIQELPEGYATEVGERGARLSGGQRQRIAIARAIVRDPRVLILDEATSALDSYSEALIEQALDRLLPGRTTLIIAHRLSTIRRANRILYIESGRVLEYGTHDELMARNGHYARLHATQFAV